MFRRRLTSVGLGRRNARGFLSGASGNVPLPTADLALRLDARLGVTTVSGDVSAWADQSGNGYAVGQFTASERPTYVDPYAPLNDQPALFNDYGAGDRCYLIDADGGTPPATANGNFTVYAVIDVGTLPSLLHTVYGANSSGTQQFLAIRRIGTARWVFYDGTAYRDTGVVASSGPQRVCLVCDADSNLCSIYVNGTQIGPAMAYLSNPIGSVFTIGSTVNGQNEWDGHIAALFIYDGVHGTTERTNVDAYITQEWGV